MKMKLKNMTMVIICFIIAITIHTNVKAAGIGMSINKSSAYVGDTFSVTISGVNGKFKINGNSNISLSTSGTQWIDGSITITGTAKSTGTGTITVTPIDASTSGANPVELTVKDDTRSKSITISQKPNQTTPTNNKTTTQKTENKKTQTPVVETKEKEEAASEFGIHSLKLIGVKENKEEVEISLDKAFNIKTFEYVCNVANDIKTIRIEKEAYEYNDLVQVLGLEEKLKVGENDITLKLAKDGKEISYHIKITKEEPNNQETEATNAIVEQSKEKEPIIVSMPLIWFIVLEVVIVGFSVGTTIVAMKYLKQNSYSKEARKPKQGKDEEKEFKKI